ncbi:MAG: ABC transporter substrate-binding protein [Deinococcales bacterium]
MKLEDLNVLYQKAQISRRDFLRAAAIMGLSASAAQQLLGSVALAQTPKSGGHLIAGMQGGSSTDSLDPTTYASDVPATLGVTFGSRLVAEPLEGAGLEGELAESWEGLDGGARWVFSLKQGVEFHNGKTMTAADVVYSLNRHRGEDSTSGAAGLMQSIKEIKATGEYEIEVLLDGPNADLPYFMSDYHLLIQPEGSTDDGIGTGPFIFSEVEHGVRYLAVRNPNYHKNGCLMWIPLKSW